MQIYSESYVDVLCIVEALRCESPNFPKVAVAIAAEAAVTEAIDF
jgi:hypothetical protein